jgi:ubiquinone/menaquinone biosynthesis C-methylase UbiE
MKGIRSLKRLITENKQTTAPQLPKYLTDTYWWAYVHPNAVWFFERQWLVNLILWGNFYKLRDIALAEFKNPSTVLQVACVYGDFTEKLAKNHPNSEIHVIDVAQIQLKNLEKKISGFENVVLSQQDSSCLEFPDGSFDNVIVFFLLHEMPENVRKGTIEQAIRVLKPGGKAVFVDYHKPTWVNPFRYVMIPILKYLEPFALDLWKTEIRTWIPQVSEIKKETYFGGLYQKVIVIK